MMPLSLWLKSREAVNILKKSDEFMEFLYETIDMTADRKIEELKQQIRELKAEIKELKHAGGTI